jgi:hypothetical protein
MLPKPLQKARTVALVWLFWLPVIVGSFLIIYNTIPYYNFSTHFVFIQERLVLFLQPLYKTCFYLHIGAGMFCVASALLQFSKKILKKQTAMHVWSGRIYVLVVLLIGAPTGLYMAFFAKGGMPERLLFIFMAISWFWFTLKGFTTILNKQVNAHRWWMIRSYAMALTAVSFRVYYLFFYLAGVPEMNNYILSLWLSVPGNLLIAECIILNRIHFKQYRKTFLT